MKTLVTGASGFIGSAVCRALLARGDAVVAMVRNPRRGQPLEQIGATVALADLTDAAGVTAAAVDCDAVVHCAGIPGSASARRFEAVHVEGTRHVVAAARTAGVRKLVNVSSQAAAFAGRDLQGLDGSEPPPRRFIDAYSETKARGEQAALAADGADLRVISVRPGVVWGRGDTTILPILIRLARTPLGIPCIGDGRNHEASSHIENVVGGILRALDADTEAGRAYFLVDDFSPEWRSFMAGQLAAVGIRPRFLRFPYVLAAGGAWTLDRLAGLARLPIPLAYFGATMACTERVFDITPARQELGYAPTVDFASGLADLRAWAEELGGHRGILAHARNR